jgi:hypothetical protein
MDRLTKLREYWIEHLNKNKMTYCEHLLFASGYGFACIKAGGYLIIHGLFPCFYKKAGSNLIHALDKAFKRNQDLR